MLEVENASNLIKRENIEVDVAYGSLGDISGKQDQAIILGHSMRHCSIRLSI